MTAYDPRPLREDDPDVISICDLLDHRLEGAEYDAVITKMATDPVFFAKANLLIKVTTAPVNWGAIRERFAREEAEAAAKQAAARRPSLGERAWSWAAKWMRHHPIVTFATACIVIMVQPSREVVYFTLSTAQAADLGKRDVRVASPAVGAYVETRQRESLPVVLPGGSIIGMQQMSRVTYKMVDKWPGGVIVTLKGEAVIEVKPADKRIYLGTMAGGAILTPGIYAVRCELGCATVKFVVGSTGTAWLKGTTATQWLLPPLHAGEKGEVRPFHDPEKTDGGPEYPVIP